MKASELFYGCDVKGFGGDFDITGVASDSRKVREGYLFICQTGTRRDGHDFALDAYRRGASAILAEHEICGVPKENLILTSDARLAESQIWYNYTGRPTDGMTKIAITGTAGKTSVAYLLRHIMTAAGHRVGMITTVKTVSGSRKIKLGENGGSSVSDAAGAMTTPDPEFFFPAVAKMRDDGCDTLIYEASSQSLVYKKTSAISSDAAVFTNLSPEHLDCHGTMENYFAAKASLAPSAGICVINGDDEWIGRLPQLFPDKKMVVCSADSGKVSSADVCALRYVSHGTCGIEYVYFSEGAVFRVIAPAVGRYSVYNTIEAAACAISLGVDPMTVKEALADFPGVDGRMYRVPLGKKIESECEFDVFIDYAHTPEALASALAALREIAGGKVKVLFGCGGDRDRKKRPEMMKAAQADSDFVILTSDNPRSEDAESIIDDVLTGADRTKPYIVIPDRTAAIKYMIKTAERGDTLLLAGKGHEKYEILRDGMHPYDEEAIVRSAVFMRSGINRDDINNIDS